MDYIDLIQKTIDYIDENIHEEITVDMLARIAGFSTYHYYRVFSSMAGLSVMEYVTKRKLQYALYELNNGKRIIDIAMNYGFETHAGFTKAFKRYFGYPPNLYRVHAPIGVPQKVDLYKLKTNKIGGVVMQPKIIEKAAFKVVGYEFKNSIKNALHTRDIPAFWAQRGLTDGTCETKLYKYLKPPRHGEYCICINADMYTDKFSYLLGVAVDNFDLAKDDMYKLEIPTATYAVFTTPPVEEKDFVNSIKGTWKYILEEWFPYSGYEIVDGKYDFEYYDEHCHTSEHEKIYMEIYVPIKAKS